MPGLPGLPGTNPPPGTDVTFGAPGSALNDWPGLFLAIGLLVIITLLLPPKYGNWFPIVVLVAYLLNTNGRTQGIVDWLNGITNSAIKTISDLENNANLQIP